MVNAAHVKASDGFNGFVDRIAFEALRSNDSLRLPRMQRRDRGLHDRDDFVVLRAAHKRAYFTRAHGQRLASALHLSHRRIPARAIHDAGDRTRVHKPALLREPIRMRKLHTHFPIRNMHDPRPRRRKRLSFAMNGAFD